MATVKILLGRVLGLVVLMIVVAIGGIAFSSSSDSKSSAGTILDYQATFNVAANGGLRVVETLTVDLPGSKHGIFRFFDTRDANGSRNRQIPKDISVLRDGQPEKFSVLSEQRARYRNIKIGDANRTITGKHVYQISYRIDNALAAGTDGNKTDFYWDLIPSGWEMPIEQAKLTVNLPAAAAKLNCAVGTGQRAGCQVEGEGSNQVTVTAGPLSAHTPVTAKIGLDVATPEASGPPWPGWLDPILGQRPMLLGLVLGIAALLGAAGYRLSRLTLEKQPASPLMYAPPDGIGPAQGTFILNEKVDDTAFVATLMHAAEKGAVTLNQNGGSWTITGNSGEVSEMGEKGWGGLDEVTESTRRSLNVIGKGSSFTVSPESIGAGRHLKLSLAEFKANTRGWALTSGMMVTSGLGGAGGLVLLICAVLAVALGVWNPFHLSALALIPGLFGIGAFGVGLTGAGTRRTMVGRELCSKVGGFRRILSTPSAQDRFDFSGRKDLYTAYLPWAVAFGCADEWEKKYRVETGEEPPMPSYFPGYTGLAGGVLVSQMVSSFDSAVSSAVSAYEDTQSSSSSGGGGFSGGGGGGGGGGGSW